MPKVLLKDSKVSAHVLGLKYSRAGLERLEDSTFDSEQSEYHGYEDKYQIQERDSDGDEVDETPVGWLPMALHPKQLRFYNSNARFNLVPAGRRTGKTALAKRRAVLRATSMQRYDDGMYAFAAPTFKQARKIFWRDLKKLVPEVMIEGKPSETELEIHLVNGATLFVVGMDKPERIEGTPIDGIVFDEIGNARPEAWFEVIRPMLSERLAWADLPGTPEGRNHYYDMVCDAKAADPEEWQVHHWTTEEILPLYLGEGPATREIAQAKRDLDPKTYNQEYNAAFETFSGRAYYSFESKPADEGGNLKGCYPDYDPSQPLVFALDFNVKPGTAVVIQEQTYGTAIIGEVTIPDDSTSERICKKLIEDWGSHRGEVWVYGDPSGGARGTAKTQGPDWVIIKDVLRSHFKSRVKIRVDRADPGHKLRLIAVNTRCKATDGTRRLFLDPRRAPGTMRDFEGVTLVKGGAAEIDKNDKTLTHYTDGVAYYLVRMFGVRGHRSPVNESDVSQEV